MNETSKARRRRAREEKSGGFKWSRVFTGLGIDIGCGPDKLPFPDCIGFDQNDGDANHLSRYFPKESFDYVHGSHVLEHMHNPVAALEDWLSLVKPKGYVIQTVPDIGAYERFVFPSKFNPDHKASFSMIYRGSCFPIHCHIPTFLAQFSGIATVEIARYVEVNYDWKKPLSVDQTWKEEDGVEIWNEMVLRKL